MVDTETLLSISGVEEYQYSRPGLGLIEGAIDSRPWMLEGLKTRKKVLGAERAEPRYGDRQN